MKAEYDRQDIEVGRQRMRPQLAVVILNWNGWGDTIECLESIYRSCPPFEWQVVVVDNGSNDGSVEKIQQWAEGRIPVKGKLLEYDGSSKPIPYIIISQSEAEEDHKSSSREPGFPPGRVESTPPLIVITVPQNLGYAGGNNVGIRYALRHGFEYVGILNNDTVVGPGMLGRMVCCFNEDATAGIMGVKTFYYEDPGKIWWAGSDLKMYRGATQFRGTGCGDSPEFSGIHPTGTVSGHALFAKREVFEEVGLFDEDLFLIWEDADLCLRTARHSSYRICVNLDVCLWHKGGGISSAGSNSETTTYFANRNRLKVVWRHGTWEQRIAFLVFYIVSRVPKFGLLILKGRFTLVWAELRALGAFVSGSRRKP
jgi:GT2 family glycosyltransferase